MPSHRDTPKASPAQTHHRYVHGYSIGERDRLISQAEFWRDQLILDGTRLDPGSRFLEIGCGVGAVLGILAKRFPDVQYMGVDIEEAQLGFARAHLAECGLPAEFRQADARELPYEDGSFDHVWIMFVLEHMKENDALKVLGEAKRVLAPGGRITAVESDFATLKIWPASESLRSTLTAVVDTIRVFGQSDAGVQLWGWLEETGFRDIVPGERTFSWRGEEALPLVRNVADALETAIGNVASVPGAPDERTLRQALQELRAFDPDTHMRYVVHKAEAHI